jgi:hypothetical protein
MTTFEEIRYVSEDESDTYIELEYSGPNANYTVVFEIQDNGICCVFDRIDVDPVSDWWDSFSQRELDIVTDAADKIDSNEYLSDFEIYTPFKDEWGGDRTDD